VGSEPSLLSAVITIAFGALAGGLTNAVAIWMLFHPYEPRGLGRLKLQGAIPKNKPRLAKTIGRTVGERLLTSEDLAQQLSAPGLRAAFDAAVGDLVDSLLLTERGALRDELPPPLLDEIEGALSTLGTVIADRMVEYADSEAFRERVEDLQQRLTREVGDRPIGELLTPERRTALRHHVERWVADAVMNPELEHAIGQWLDRQVSRFAADRTPLLERLPSSLVAAIEKEIAGYLPLAIDRITAALSNPASRRNIQQSLHKLFEGFVKNLLIHERLVARLVVTEKTFARLLDNVERDGVEHVTKLLEEPEVRSEVARSVNEAVVKFLRRPLAEHLDGLGPERVDAIKETVRSHIVDALRDESTRAYAFEKVDVALAAAETRTWGELLKHVDPERAADWASAALKSDQARSWVTDGTRAAVSTLLDRPIGTPAHKLPEGSHDRIRASLSPVFWDWIQHQIPNVVGQLDIRTMVEEKVLGFSLERIEEIVRRTTQRELDLIVRLGYALGAIVGALAYAVSLFVS